MRSTRGFCRTRSDEPDVAGVEFAEVPAGGDLLVHDEELGVFPGGPLPLVAERYGLV